MAKKQSYGVDNQAFRSTILSWMALSTFVTVVLVDLLKKVLVDSLKSSDFSSFSSFDFSSLETSLSLLSVLLSAGLVPVTFSIISSIYGQFIWKINRFDKVPNLSGTWIGMAQNHLGVERLRLELMKIEQDWHEILITVEVYPGNNAEPTEVSSWLDDTENKTDKHKLKVAPMGTECSKIALITECNVGSGDLIFNYEHYPETERQVRFQGAMFLKYKKKGKFHELGGDYINDKRGKDFRGLVGKILFRRVSHQLIETEEALQKAKDENVLAYLHGVVTAEI
jgi:hypothetical protein